MADANTATFYNRGQVYRRDPIEPRGDDSVWIAPATSVLAEVADELGLTDREEAPFGWRRRPIRARPFLRQAALVRYLLSAPRPEALVVEETALQLLGDLVATQPNRMSRVSGSPPRHRELVERAKALIDARFADKLSLGDIARQVGCSQYHLSRLFRSRVGRSIHAYRDQIRLRTALRRLWDTKSLTELALALGYDSHSHFTHRFSRAFGMPPSRARKLSRRRLPTGQASSSALSIRAGS